MKSIKLLMVTICFLLWTDHCLCGSGLVVFDANKDGMKNWYAGSPLVGIKEVSIDSLNNKGVEIFFYGDPDIPTNGASVPLYLEPDNCPRIWRVKYTKIHIWIKGDGSENEITMNFCNSGPEVKTGHCVFNLKDTSLHKLTFDFKTMESFETANQFIAFEISSPVSEGSFIVTRIVVE